MRIVIRELVVSCLDLETGTTFLRDVLSDNGKQTTENGQPSKPNVQKNKDSHDSNDYAL